MSDESNFITFSDTIDQKKWNAVCLPSIKPPPRKIFKMAAKTKNRPQKCIYLSDLTKFCGNVFIDMWPVYEKYNEFKKCPDDDTKEDGVTQDIFGHMSHIC